MNYRSLSILISVATLWVTQTDSAAKLYIRTLGWNVEQQLYIESSGRPLQIAVEDRSLSDFVEIDPPPVLRLYAAPPTPPKADEPPQRPLAEVAIPTGLSQVILFISAKSTHYAEASAEKSYDLKVRIVDDSLAAFPRACARVFNFAKHPIRCQIFAQFRTLNPGEERTWTIPTPPPGRTFLRLATELKKGRWHDFASQSMDIISPARALIFLYDQEEVPRKVETLLPDGTTGIVEVNPEPRPAFWLTIWDRKIVPSSSQDVKRHIE